MEFKSEDKIIIYSLDGLVLNIQPELYGMFKYRSDAYHLIIGEFFYCGLLVEGHLVLSEKRFNKIIDLLVVELQQVHKEIIYFASYDSERLHNIKLRARCIGEENLEDEDEENFVFHLIEK